MRTPRSSCLALVLALALPAAAAESIWIEGESSTSFGFNRHGWYQNTGLEKRLMSPGRPEVTAGDWLAHYVPGANSPAQARYTFNLVEGGSYAWWIRTNPLLATLSYAVDGAALRPIDLSDSRELVNIVQGIDIRWLAWVKVGDFPLAPGAHTVTIQAEFDARRGDTHGGIDCMALVNHPWEPIGTLPPGQVLQTPGPSVWFPLRAGDDPFSPDSLTDLSALVPAPAGNLGALRAVGWDFEFALRPGVAVKLIGVNTGAPLPTEALQRRQARLWRKNGINLVRLHPVEDLLGVLRFDSISGQRVLDPVALDRLDRWFAVLKEHGIYSDWSLFYPHVITTDDGYPANLYAELPSSGAGKSSSGMVAFQRALQDAEWEWLRRLLDHVNPYTGLAYKNEPALAFLEAHNEDSIFWHAPLNDLEAGRYPLHTAEIKRQWRDWVRARYGTDTALATAWGAGRRAGDSVNNANMDIYGAWQLAADAPTRGAGPLPAERARAGDFIRFLAETQRAYYERRRGEIRATGFDSVYLTTAWMAGGPASAAANLWSDDAGDAIDRHSYFGGGTGGWYVATGSVNNETHCDRPGRGLVGGFTYDSGGTPVALYQVENKPVVMSEWTSSPPNQWKAEALPLQLLYGMGLQGWDASIHFASSLPRMGSGWPGKARGPDPFVTETPAYLGQLPALGRAIHNRHFREGDLVAARRLDLPAVCAGYDALSQDLPSGAYPGDTSLRTPPEVMAIGKVTMAIGSSLPASARASWQTYWDSAARTITSTTGDLFWDYGNRVVEIRNPKTAGVVGWAGGRNFLLPGVEVQVRTPFVSLLFTPLDDRPLVDSTHILVTALARDQQLETAYDATGGQLLRLGGPPLLLEPVEATLDFQGAAVTSAKVVDLHGVPQPTDVARSGNQVTIDGRYETYYYEIKRNATPGRCLSRSDASALAPVVPPLRTLFLATPRPDGISLDPAALFAQVPYQCNVVSGVRDPDPVLDPASRPLVLYQIDGTSAVPLRLVKDRLLRTVRFEF